MKKITYTILFLPFLFGCKAHHEIFEKGQTYENFRGFIPVDPIEYDDKVQITDNARTIIINKEIKLLNNDEILQLLNNETVLVSIGQVNADGGISYLPITISAKHSSYKVTMDYMKFATIAQGDDQGSFIGFNRVGVGLRLITLITTSEAGINIGDLSSIGFAAKAGKVKGTLMIEVVGIKSKEVTTILPLPSEINQTTIQNAMQALATIKSKIYDSETKLYPQVMAIKPDSTAYKRNNTKSKDIVEISTQKDEKTINELKLQIGGNKFNSLNKSSLAQSIEVEAFDLLFSKRIDDAIAKFDECEKIYPKFHSIFDISNFLKSEKTSLSDPNSVKWKEVYSKILTNYSWKLPREILERLKTESNK
nr:hypothetical protein [uncultured Flavobacterium sp.]